MRQAKAEGGDVYALAELMREVQALSVPAGALQDVREAAEMMSKPLHPPCLPASLRSNKRFAFLLLAHQPHST